MFKDEYSKQIDSIRADGYIKQKVLKSIENKEKVKNKAKKIRFIRAAVAIAASFAIVFSVVIINKNGRNTEIPVGNTVKTYDDIYKTVETFIPKTNAVDEFLGGIFNGFGNKDSGDVEYELEYEYAADDITDGEAMPSKGNSSQNNGANKFSSDTKDESATVTKDDVDKSETNTQVEGVDESDVIKTDGKYIYSFSATDGEIRIIKAGKEPKLLKKLSVRNSDFSPTSNMYLSSGKLIIIGTKPSNEKAGTVVYIYDVSNPEKAEKVYECAQSGFYNTSRLIGDKLYLISNYRLNMNSVSKDEPETYIPCVKGENFDGAVEADDVYINRNCSRAVYTVVCGFDINNGKLLGSQSLLGGTYTLYCSTKNIITADYSDGGKTNIARFEIDNGKVEFKAEGEIDGNLLNQFSIDEYGGYFRFVTTVQGGKETRNGEVVMYELEQSNALTVLDGDLKKVSSIDNIAPDERVYSVRFMGNVAYFVTFRQVDPLFSVDLSDPKNPKIIGALKIPGFSNYLFPYGKGKLLGIGQDADEKTGRTGGVKLSMFDISNPADVKESAKLILDVDYSDALYGHKESIVDTKKNVIGFSVYGKNGSEYRIYSFNDGQFSLKAQIKLGDVYHNIRGLYINSEFYVITEKNLLVYDMNSYTKIVEISLS